jgi:cytochrome c5
MKRIITIAIGLIIVACSTEKKFSQNVPEPTQQLATASGHSLKQLKRGRGIYLSQCGQCHELKYPKNISCSDWHIITPGMAWNAGINKTDEKALLSYLLAVGKCSTTQRVLPHKSKSSLIQH